jgi:hypothetical protein
MKKSWRVKSLRSCHVIASLILGSLLATSCSGTSSPKMQKLESTIYMPELGEQTPSISILTPSGILGRTGLLVIDLLDVKSDPIGVLQVSGTFQKNSIVGTNLYGPCSDRVAGARISHFEPATYPYTVSTVATTNTSDFFGMIGDGWVDVTLAAPRPFVQHIVSVLEHGTSTLSVMVTIPEGMREAGARVFGTSPISQWQTKNSFVYRRFELVLCGEAVEIPSEPTNYPVTCNMKKPRLACDVKEGDGSRKVRRFSGSS